MNLIAKIPFLNPIKIVIITFRRQRKYKNLNRIHLKHKYKRNNKTN